VYMILPSFNDPTIDIVRLPSKRDRFSRLEAGHQPLEHLKLSWPSSLASMSALVCNSGPDMAIISVHACRNQRSKALSISVWLAVRILFTFGFHTPTSKVDLSMALFFIQADSVFDGTPSSSATLLAGVPFSTSQTALYFIVSRVICLRFTIMIEAYHQPITSLSLLNAQANSSQQPLIAID